MPHVGRRWLLTALGLGLGLGFGPGACTLANPNHCFNIAVDPNEWCAAVDAEKPFCSPCAAADYGCVAEEPDPSECPTYTIPATSTGTEDSSGTGDTGTEGSTETGTDGG